MLVRNACKNLKSYDNPLCQFSNGGKKKKKKSGKIPKIVAYGAFDETVCTAPLGPISHKKNPLQHPSGNGISKCEARLVHRYLLSHM